MKDLLEDIKDIWSDGIGKVSIIFLALVFASIPVLLYFSYRDEKRWAQFKVEHKCRVIAHQDASSHVGIGMTSNSKTGAVVITESAKTSYLCDDGVTYTRDE